MTRFPNADAWRKACAADAVLGTWQPWAALACGLAGLLLSQAAFQAGALGSALAAMMVTDPIVGVALGLVVFGEHIAPGTAGLVQAAGLLVALVGVWLLANRPAPATPADIEEKRVSSHSGS